MQQVPVPRIEVKSTDHVVKSHRQTVAQRVIDYFGSSLPNSKLLCFLDDEDPASLRDDRGPANRALYGPIHNVADLEGWPTYVRECIYPTDRFGGHSRGRVIDDLIYLYGNTCAEDMSLTISLAHELQHAIQHSKKRELWAVNSLVANDLSRDIIEALGLGWADIPIEVDARTVSKGVAESFFGEELVRQHIDKKIAEQITESDVRDWKFIRTVNPAMTIDLAAATRRLFERLMNSRSELEAVLQEKRQNPDYSDIDLAAFFRPAAHHAITSAP